MQRKSRLYFITTGILFLTFVVFTILVKTVDVKPIGPRGSEVGFAAINRFFFQHLGTSRFWYAVTSWLGFVAVAVIFAFAILGLVQFIRRRSLQKVDERILLLGGFYFVVLIVYAIFEFLVINYRPVILTKELEVSYPSSHTMLIICVMVTAMMQLHHYLREKRGWLMVSDIVSVLIIAVTVIGRLLSGVHWFSDIIAGIILSSALIFLYYSALKYIEEKQDYTPV
ncbi:phosphatidylglycerophosphatase B [uncultured Eubacterium sp.]|nr:phosphatidylglycerophosphatase B [uncultured Eubacterium sp.]